MGDNRGPTDLHPSTSQAEAAGLLLGLTDHQDLVDPRDLEDPQD